MCPTIILDKHSKQVKMVVGGAGGTNITTSVAQVTKNTEIIHWHLNILDYYSENEKHSFCIGQWLSVYVFISKQGFCHF